MKIHHIRHATFLIEAGDNFILIDPMLGEKGTQLPFTLFRFKPRRNPLVDLPANAMQLIEKTTHCLLTHRHPDHLDEEGEKFLIDRNIPVVVGGADAVYFREKGLNIIEVVEFWEEKPFLGGKIVGTPARHGNGFIARPMGDVIGFYLELPDQPSVYISADTVLMPEVEKVLRDFKPGLAVVAAGSAQLDIGKPILMTFEEVISFIRLAPGKVYANHLECVNHCPTTRVALQARLAQDGMLQKVFVPSDGQSFEV